ncbi:MAG: hypothetical protein M3Y13_07295, partial [Armatimonadota bacterium]|nr:hypothetical protein [Armatimonadota bacterium]
AIAQVHGQPGDSEATVTLDADVEEIGHVRRTNTFYDALNIDQSAIGDLETLMRLLQSNPFYPLSVKSLKMTVTIQNRHDTAEIDHIFLKQSKFAPGDTVNIGVVLKPYKRDLITRTIAVKIPESVQDGPLSHSVEGRGSGGGGAISLGGLILMRGPETSSEPAGNIAQLVRQFTEKPHNDDLVARLTLPTTAISIDGEKLSGLPPTLAQIMQSTRSTGLKTVRDEVKVTQAQPYIVSGSESLTITVQKKSVSESGTGSTTSVSPTPTPTTPDGAAPNAIPVTSPALSTSGVEPDNAARLTADARSTPRLDVFDDTAVHLTSASTSPKTPTPAQISVKTSSAAPAATSSTTTPAVKTVGRLPSIWHQSAATDFAAGTLQNVSVTSQGDVRLSASLQKVAETTENYVWSLLPDGQGNVYIGTGDHGTIYKMDAAGKLTPFFKTGELEVTALAQDSQGNIYAGTAPNGIVFQVGPDGKGSKVFTAQEKYITALNTVVDRLYIATGGGIGRVYAGPEKHLSLIGGMHSTFSSQPIFTSPETNILSLTSDKDGNVYAGSSPNGIVYKITPDGKSQVLYNATEANIAALAVDSQGNVYAGTSPKGNVYEIAPDGTAKTLPLKAASGILSLRLGDNDMLYACAGNTVYRIGSDETVQSFTAPTDEQFLTLGLSKGDVYAGTAIPGSVYNLGAPGTGGLRGVFQSAVHDAGLPARWGSISWIAQTPPGTQISLQTRSGNVERPDTSWSGWSSDYSNGMGQPVSSPPGRFLQYQAVLTSTTAGDAPRLEDVSIYYLPRNRPPSVKIIKPDADDA